MGFINRNWGSEWHSQSVSPSLPWPLGLHEDYSGSRYGAWAHVHHNESEWSSLQLSMGWIRWTRTWRLPASYIYYHPFTTNSGRITVCNWKLSPIKRIKRSKHITLYLVTRPRPGSITYFQDTPKCKLKTTGRRNVCLRLLASLLL